MEIGAEEQRSREAEKRRSGGAPICEKEKIGTFFFLSAAASPLGFIFLPSKFCGSGTQGSFKDLLNRNS